MTPRSRKSAAGLTYADAGVDIVEADALVSRIARRNKAIGGFSGAFPLKMGGMKNPVLLASTDGVGTKLLIAQQLQRLDTIGIDLVAMVVNDLLVVGAKPLFFLDYYATGKLTARESDAILSGIFEGCDQAGMVLLGGETAEMPGVYAPGHFDLAGFGVGVADRKDLIDDNGVHDGDVLIGVSSSGIHSNGYSLVRAVVSRAKLSLKRKYRGLSKPLGQELLTPTIIYSKAVAALLKRVRPVAMAHITGGGLEGNLVRVLPRNARAEVDCTAWIPPTIFPFLQEAGKVSTAEMYRVFNMGIGYVVVVRPRDVKAALGALTRSGVDARVIGGIHRGKRGVTLKNRDEQ